MKVTIDEGGCLRVTAESGIECFALQCWWESFGRPEGQRLTTIAVQFPDGHRPQWAFEAEGAPEVKA